MIRKFFIVTIVFFVTGMLVSVAVDGKNHSAQKVSEEMESSSIKPSNEIVVAANTPIFEYYKIIETNNLFRPLGWQPKPPEAPYVLIGLIEIDGKRKAWLVSKNQKSYYVSKGDAIEGGKVLDILDNHLLLLYEGKKFELRFGEQRYVGDSELSKSEHQKDSSSPRKKSTDANKVDVAARDGKQRNLATKIEANRSELNKRTERWLRTGKVTRQMFYDFLRRRGVSPAEIFRDAELRQQMQDEFHMETMEMEDRGEF